MSWTDERIGLLKKMWKEGKSAADIAKTLGKGVTRNAVIGKAHRMGLSGRPSPIKAQTAPKKKAVAAPKTKTAAVAPLRVVGKKGKTTATGAAKVNPAIAREVEEMKRAEKEAPQIGGGVAFIDLTERMCKWPIGDPKEDDFSFCGLDIRIGTPYCPDHASMAYQTSSRGRSSAAAAAVVVKDDEEKDVEVDDVDDVDDTDAEDAED